MSGDHGTPEGDSCGVIITDELDSRPSRLPDYAAESRALNALAEVMSMDPDTLLQHLVELAMALTRSESAGISLLEFGADGQVFRWVATAGSWSCYRDGTIPANASLCGGVIARDTVVLMKSPERAFPALQDADARISESLLAPVYIGGVPVGTLWVVKHQPDGQFEAEDARILKSLARFASAALQTLKALQAAQATSQQAEARVQQLVALAEISSEFFATCDMEFRLIYSNAAAMRMVGIADLKQLKRTRVLELFFPEDQAFITREFFPRVLREGHGSIETRFRHLITGEPVWVVYSMALLENAMEQPTGFGTVTHNITDRKKIEDSLRTSEIRYRRLFEAAHDGVLILDPDTQKIIEANPFMTKLLGYSRNELIGKELFQIGFLADVQASRNMFQALKETRQVRYDDLPLRAQDGITREVEVVANLYDEDGRTVVQCNVRDISERKRAELILRQNDERQTFLLKLTDAIQMIGDPLEVQTAALRVLGEHLAVNRAYYNVIDEEQDTYEIYRTYANGVAPLIGQFRLSEVSYAAKTAGSGQIVVFDDASIDARMSEAERAAWASMEVAAGVGVPLHKDGRWVAGLGVHSATPRRWTVEDIELIRETAERTWAAVQQAQAETALQSGAARDAFRVQLTDALRSAATAEEAQEAAMRVLGDYLQASRVMFGGGDEGSPETFTNHHEYCRAPAMPSSVGQHRWNAFGLYIGTEFLAGRTLVVNDVQAHFKHSPDELTAYEMVDIKAYLAVPLARQERITAYLAINHTTPHAWTPDEIALAEETAERIWAAVNRARTEAALRERQNFLDGIFEVLPGVLYIFDLDENRVVFSSKSLLARAYSSEEVAAMGDEFVINLMHVDDQPRFQEHLACIQNMGPGTMATFEYRMKDKVGEWHWYLNTDTVFLRDEDGVARQFIGVALEISDRKLAEIALQESEARQHQVLEASRIGTFDVDLVSGEAIWNSMEFELLGLQPGEALPGAETFFRHVHPEDLAGARASWESAIHKGSFNAEFRIIRPDGEVRWLKGRGNMLYDQNLDEPRPALRYLGVNYDITERKSAEEHARLLMAEVNHRAKNLLAVVQSVAQQTAKSGNPQTFAARLSNRINGLAANQDLLVKNLWHGVDVKELVLAQLAHFKDLIGNRIYVEGDELMVTAAASQGIGMALHEISTNAAKYGALSNSAGQVRIEWRISADPEPTFFMSWVETEGPTVKAPTRTGFGQTVIKRLIEIAVGGTVVIDYAAKGFSWHLQTPVSKVIASSNGVNNNVY